MVTVWLLEPTSMTKKSQTYTRRLMSAKAVSVDVPVDADLQWFLQSSDAALGERSSMAALTAMIEFGCPTATTDPEARVNDRQLGWGKTLTGDVQRERVCAKAWAILTPTARHVLLARYCLIVGKLPPGLHGGLGDLAGVALLCAHLRDQTDKLLQSAENARQTSDLAARVKLWQPWANRAQKANAEAHAAWILARAELEQVA